MAPLKSNATMGDTLRLNVGGKLFETTRATLCAEDPSMLASLFRPDSPFAPPTELDGEIFLDRNPATFGYIVDYLRDECHLLVNPPQELLKRLRVDADFYGLVGLVAACDAILLSMNETVRLCVGGKYFVTTRTTLSNADANSKFSDMFSSAMECILPREKDGTIFLDLNPASFGYVLDYLRNERRLMEPPPLHLVDRLRTDGRILGLYGLANYTPTPKFVGCFEHMVVPLHQFQSSSLGDSGWRIAHVIPAIHGVNSLFNNRPAKVLLEWESA
jgi:hypothetical protein